MGRWVMGMMVLLAMLSSAELFASPQPVRDYLLLGGPTDESTPRRSCEPHMLRGHRQSLDIPAPAGGWSGQPQALDVFNVFAGEVAIRHGDREICGNMGDARTRDSRFRSGVGIVVVPAAGSREPIHVSWATPLKVRWGPTLRLGAPSPVQQRDTARLLVRTACVAVALALALSALLGFFTSRDRIFLAYVGACAIFVLWQCVLGGLSGYPEPWLPLGVDSAWWLVGLTAVAQAVLLPMMWRLNAGDLLWPRARSAITAVSWAMLGMALLVPWMDWSLLGWASDVLEAVHFTGCVAALLAGAWAWSRRDRWAVIGLLALAPFLVMMVADLASAQWLLAHRVEALQLSVTWLLMMAAYALNQRLGNLREQRDALRQLADTDSLTGLPNRRAGLRELAVQIERARTEGTPLVIGFLDIDLFKEINDRHGHAIGDDVLQAVAAALRASLRGRDEVFRMGGEEFLLLLPGASREVATARLRQVASRITEAGHALRVDGLSVTASIGLAQWRDGQDDLAGLLRRADHAMYGAKRAGRDQVMDGEQLDAPVPM
mgnify:CR=1 FL=1